MKTTLHVFISSPGDLAAERGRMRDVVRRVSASEEARAANVELVPLLWEDLPPGQAEPGDLQSRVNALLERYGLKHYEVYAGAMKGRLGTPTPKFRSGTIEELETAIAGHRSLGVPAEVLFYFVESDTASAEVLAFRQELSARGFLFATVADAEALERRFEEHLTRVVREWRQWRNRLRRTLRSARVAAAIAVAILAVAAAIVYLRFDRGGARRIEEALRSGGAVAALAVYEREAPYLLLHQKSARMELRAAVAASVRAGAMDGASAAPAAALWDRALRNGLWSAEDADARQLLARTASRRMIDALLAEGTAVPEWPRRLRPFELGALREFAREAVRDPAFAEWPSIEHRAAVCVLAQAWRPLSELAAETFVLTAPADVVSRWVTQTIAAKGDPEVHAIVLSAERRGDPAILAALLDALQARPTHHDDLFRAIAGVGATAFVPFAKARVLHAPPETWPVLLAPETLQALTADQRSELGTRLLQTLSSRGDLSADATIAAYRALGTIGGEAARRRLLGEYEDYRSERTSYGMQQKAALIDALAALGERDAAERGLALARIAHREGEERNLNDWPVQAAYLRALARRPPSWPGHAAHVRALVVRRVNGETPMLPDGFEDAAVALLRQLSPPQIIDLLALPPGIVDDAILGNWEPRWYILRALAGSDQEADPQVVGAVLSRMPVIEEVRLRVARVVARIGGETARTFFAREYLRDPAANGEYLKFTNEAFLGEQADVADPEAVLEAAEALPDQRARCRVVARVVARHASTRPAILWPHAATCRIADDALFAAAARELQQSKPAAPAAAVRYLAAFGRDWPAADALARFLRTADVWDWITVTQHLSERPPDVAQVDSVIGTRAVLTVTDRDAAPEVGTFAAGRTQVSNPLLAILGVHGGGEGARRLLQRSGNARRVEVLGAADDPAMLYRAYCLWLAANGAAHLPLQNLAGEHAIVRLLADHNPPLVRAAAAVCIAAASRAADR